MIDSLNAIPRLDRNDMIDAFLYASVKIMPSKWHPKHPTRTFQKLYIFKGHPFVTRMCWLLRRWIRIRPWVAVLYAEPDDADAIYLRDRNTLVMGERHYSLFKGKKL